jgi:hypothetical protein
MDPTGAWSIDVIDSTLALDATRAVTAISTGGRQRLAHRVREAVAVPATGNDAAAPETGRPLSFPARTWSRRLH